MKKNYNIFDEAIPEELQEQYQKDLSQTIEILNKRENEIINKMKILKEKIK